VEGVILRTNGTTSSTEYITMRGGIIGFRLPELQPTFLQLSDGDILTMATDGIHSEYVHSIASRHPTDLLSAGILHHYAKPTDDALVLVARWHSPTGQQEVI
jgi:hypothetical protein